MFLWADRDLKKSKLVKLALFCYILAMFSEDIDRSKKFTELIIKHGFTKNEISVAIIDLNKKEPKVFGFNMDNFIYPASAYKIFIGAEVLRKVENNELSLDEIIEIKSLDNINKETIIFPRDSHELLNVGDKVSLDNLLDLMLTRSNNLASNTLLTLIGKESLNNNIIYKYRWYGSEVTKKFLDRVKENKPYQFSSTTLTCARHLVEFFYLVEKEKLISPFVSRKLKEYMLNFRKQGRTTLFLENNYKNYYSKGGWLEANLYKINLFSAIKSILLKRWAIIRYGNEAGVITGPNSKYAVALLSVNKSIFPSSYFPVQDFAKVVFNFMEAEDLST